MPFRSKQNKWSTELFQPLLTPAITHATGRWAFPRLIDRQGKETKLTDLKMEIRRQMGKRTNKQELFGNLSE